MVSVGIDVSKGNSYVAARRPFGEEILSPAKFFHTVEGLRWLARTVQSFGDEVRVVIEASGRYHEPVVAALMEIGVFVCVLNPVVSHQSGTGSVRKVKNDRMDAKKLAKYGMDNWEALQRYTSVDDIRQQLKLLSRQYNLYMKIEVSLQNNLISLLDKSFPGVNKLFKSPSRQDGHHKWIDFVTAFWHRDCVSRISLNAFSKRYARWCHSSGYNYSKSKAEEIHRFSKEQCTTLPKNSTTKLLITLAASQLNTVNASIATFRKEAINLASQLPEYETVIGMYGVGEITATQLIAEIGDVLRFPNRSCLVAFAGVDPVVNASGKHQPKSNPSSKRGSPHLRKTLFQVVSTHLKLSPSNEPVYQFLARKRSEGKPYYVYMTAAANKFLRIYYARVKAVLLAQNAIAA